MTRSLPNEPLFLARENYRRRRLGDAARLLPVLGLILFLLPLLWSDAARTAGGLMFIFTIWAMLILGMAFIARRLGASAVQPTESEADATKD